MAGRAVANRSDPVIVETARAPVEVVRQQWRLQRAGSRMAGGNGSLAAAAARLEARDHGSRCDAPGDLAAAGKQPGWLAAAADEAERRLSALPAEPSADPPAGEDVG